MLKDLAKSILRELGYELKRFHPQNSDTARLAAMLRTHRIDVVLDIGANIGQFGRKLRTLGYRGRIVSFEPLPVEHEALSKAAFNDPLWEVAPRVALGSEDGDIEIHVASNSQSSSPLRMLDTHLCAAPEVRYVGRERVPMHRLDALAPRYLRQDSAPFLKIDTQGWEDRVLQGASQTLDRISGLQLELSLVSLYEGQRLFDDLLEQVKASGFDLWSISPALLDSRTGRLLQVDATFFRH